jgi:hypothetical protein
MGNLHRTHHDGNDDSAVNDSVANITTVFWKTIIDAGIT